MPTSRMPFGRQVAVSDLKVVVINIADTGSALSVSQEITTAGGTKVDRTQHVVMAPDDSTVRFFDSRLAIGSAPENAICSA